MSVTVKELQGIGDFLLNCEGRVSPEGAVLVIIQDLLHFTGVILAVRAYISNILWPPIVRQLVAIAIGYK